MIHRPSLSSLSAPVLGAALLLLSSPSLAQDAPADAAEPPAEGEGASLDEEPGMEGEEALGEAPAEEGAAADDPPPDDTLPDELGERRPDGSTQLLLGARYRMLITPKWLINMFGVDGGRSVILHGVGPEIGGYFGKTADGFMVIFSPWFAGYGLEETPFKGKNDDDSAWEIIESDMKVIYLTVDAMWDHKIVDRVSVNVGIGAGLGIVAGKLRRNEAYVDPSDPDISADSDKGWPGLSYCEGPGNPNANECPGDGNYDISQGGSSDRWPVYPWLNFQLGLKYQPVDEFIGRLEMGLGSSGFWLGLGADYSLFL